MTLPDIIVALLGGVPTSVGSYGPFYIPFYELATICFGLKFMILTSQRNVRNCAREMIYGD